MLSLPDKSAYARTRAGLKSALWGYSGLPYAISPNRWRIYFVLLLKNMPTGRLIDPGLFK